MLHSIELAPACTPQDTGDAVEWILQRRRRLQGTSSPRFPPLHRGSTLTWRDLAPAARMQVWPRGSAQRTGIHDLALAPDGGV